MTAIVVVSLAAVLGAVALALDRAYVDGAMIELQRAADAAALAAVRELPDDDLLRGFHDPQDDTEAALLAAARLARLHTVAGQRVAVRIDGHTSPFDPLAAPPQPFPTRGEGAGDVVIGRFVRDGASGERVFLATDPELPAWAVEVTAHRTRMRGNPVRLLLGGLFGLGEADVLAVSRAEVDNFVVGIQPLGHAPVPVMPLSVLASDPTGTRSDTWEQAIRRRMGQDLWAWDEASGTVLPGGDGIGELVLISAAEQTTEPTWQHEAHPEPETAANVVAVAIGGYPDAGRLARQTAEGCLADDFDGDEGDWSRLDSAAVLACTESLSEVLADTLWAARGSCRVWFLHAGPPFETATGESVVACVGLVGARVMDVQVLGDGRMALTIQPGILCSRTLVTADDSAWPANPYLYRPRLVE